MINRRDLLRGAMFGAGASVFSGRLVAAAAKAAAVARPGALTNQILFVFQRGGNDGLNTLIPHGDLTAYQAVRPTLAVTNGIVLPGAPHARLSPELERLVAIDTAGHLAMIHQFGDPSASRSHFTAMDMFEKGLQPSPPPTQAQLAAATGFVPSMLAAAAVAPYDAGVLPAALSLSPLMQTMFAAGQSNQVSAHVRDLTAVGAPPLMTAAGVETASLQHGVDHVAAPSNPWDGHLGYELAFGHGTNAALEALGFAHAFASTGRFPLTSQDLAAAALATGSTVVPSHDPKGQVFMAYAEQAVHTLLNSPNTRVAGIEIGGWDTHSKQAAEHPNLLRYLGWALRDMYDAIQAAGAGNRITIVVVSEFGRTIAENSGEGTDHGCGGVALVVDANVVGGTYNAHGGAPGTREYGQVLATLTAPPTDPKYLDTVEVKTGLRDVLGELMVKRIGVPVNALPAVLPGYPAATTGFLGFLV